MAGVYIHIPFCKQLCSYCDFYFSISLQRKDEMLQALLSEMDLRKPEVALLQKANNNPTLYFGGGTPTIYSPAQLQQLTAKARLLFLPSRINEFTVEANPDDLSLEYLQGLLDMGANRLSIGIQSFIDRDLQWMCRRHSALQAIESVKKAQSAGFNNISIDLIYGIPAMSMSEWAGNIEQAIQLGVQHISAYHLTIEPRTLLGRQLQRGLLHPIDDDTSAEQYALLEKLMAQAGYIHYEISNFALPGYFSKHNTSYWQQQPYIGIGPSAHSYNGLNVRRWNMPNNVQYINNVINNGIYYEEEQLSIYDRYNEYLLTSLRTIWGADLKYVRSAFGNELYAYLLHQAAPAIKLGNILCENDILKIPSARFLISDAIIAPLFWA